MRGRRCTGGSFGSLEDTGQKDESEMFVIDEFDTMARWEQEVFDTEASLSKTTSSESGRSDFQFLTNDKRSDRKAKAREQ